MARTRSVSASPRSTSQYDEDFVEWTQQTATLLRMERFAEVEVLLAHLLEWQNQPRRRSGSWRATIRAQRSRLQLTLRDSPSLRAQIPAMLSRRYSKAVALAADETGFAVTRFPRRCPYTPEQVLDGKFLPG